MFNIETVYALLPAWIRLRGTQQGEPRDVVSFFGGQGSLNVNSWSPDSERFAYVAYPIG